MAFNFTIGLQPTYVVRSLPDPRTGQQKNWIILHGLASDSGEDLLDGQMAPECVIHMANTVNAKGKYAPVYRNVQSAKAKPVEVDVEHEGADLVGFAHSARILTADDLTAEQRAAGVVAPALDVELWIEADAVAGRKLKRSLDNGDQLGLSIFGDVPEGTMHIKRGSKGQPVEYYERVELQRIALTTKPANPRMYAHAVATIRRSLRGTPMDPDENNTEETTEQASAETAQTPAETVTRSEAATSPNEGAVSAAEQGQIIALHDGDTVPAALLADANAAAARAEAATAQANPATFDAGALEDIASLTGGRPPAPATAPVATPPATAREMADDLAAAADTATEPAPAQSAMDRLRAIAGGVTAATTPAPAATEEPSASETETPSAAPEQTVARALTALTETLNEHYVARSEVANLVSVDRLNTVMDTIAEALAPLPEFMTTLQRSLDEVREENARLRTELEALGNEAPARRGRAVLRSLIDPAPAPDAAQVQGPGLAEAMEILSRAGRPELAMKLKMGWLTKSDLPTEFQYLVS